MKGEFAQNNAKMKTVFNISYNFLTILTYFVAITTILNFFGVDTSSIIAVAGIGGVAIAFAAQSIVKDIIQGAFILAENQYNIGDLITVNGSTGTVYSMGVRITKLKDVQGSLYIIPNGSITTVINHSRYPMRAFVEVLITDNVSILDLKNMINDKMKNLASEKGYFTENPSVIGVDSFTDYGYKLLVAGYVENGKQWEAQRFMRENIIILLQENKISFSRIGV